MKVSKMVGSEEGACPSPDYRNKVMFVPTQHPILLPVPIIYDAVIMRQLPHFRICVRARVIVSITGSVSYLNENFVVFLALVVPSVERLTAALIKETPLM